jgi:hypothetical protein
LSVIGKLFYNIYYKPLNQLKYIKRLGGTFNFFRIEKGRKAMSIAASKLSVEPQTNELQVWFLTGKKFWELTAFCMYSLAKVTDNIIKPVFVDDGTFDDDLIKKMKIQFPVCEIKTSSEIQKTIAEALPLAKYPIINKKRELYPHIKKLTDVHAGSAGWKLVLDSDMLFFKYPGEIISWLKEPTEPIFLREQVCSYHYSINLMERLTGQKILPNLNVGVVGLKSENINWDKLELWIGLLEEKQGNSYLLEQALSAMLVAGEPVLVADEKQYIVMPGEQESKHPSATLHHYVDTSKEWYYKIGWKHITNT